MTSSHLLSFRKLIELILFFVQRYVTAFHCFPRGLKEKTDWSPMIFSSLHYVSYISFHVVLESSSKNPKVTADCEEPRLTGAIRSFPDEVQLCVSSIPGASYGVCAKEHIPLGTWIGPYEGKRITSQQLTPQIDSEHLWEVQLILYLHFCFFSLSIPSWTQRTYMIDLLPLKTDSAVLS